MSENQDADFAILERGSQAPCDQPLNLPSATVVSGVSPFIQISRSVTQLNQSRTYLLRLWYITEDNIIKRNSVTIGDVDHTQYHH